MNEEEALEIFKNLILLPYYWKITDKYKGTINFIGAMEGNEAIQIISNLIKKLQEENEELKNKYATFIKMSSEVIANSIPKSKLKEFFSSRLEKYQEADDGKYEQDYLTRGELELVDRYKECKEIAKIILEEEINSEVPQNCIPKSLVKEKIEEYKACGIEEGDYHIFQEEINALQDLLERGEGR